MMRKRKNILGKVAAAIAAAAILVSGMPDVQAAAPQWNSPFGDIGNSSWYYTSVEFAHQTGLMVGRGAGIFDPNGTMTRAMAMTTLWRYAGEPSGYTNNFSDVPNNTWYTQAVAWASENGIVQGVGNGKFAPNDNITREQLSAMLYRFADSRGLAGGNGNQANSLSSYSDDDTVSSWAAEPMEWVTDSGIINGIAGNNGSRFLDPRGQATRAQMSAVLMRFAENIDNYEGAKLGGTDALQIALDHAGVQAADTSFAKVEAGFENGKAIYEVEFYANNTEYDYEIDATTSKILEVDHDMENQYKPGSNVTPGSQIAESQALEIALAHAGVQAADTVYAQVKKDSDNGRQIYEVEFYAGNMEYDYEIDAATGKILDFDYDMEGRYVPENNITPGSGVTEAQALQIALTHAGVQESNAVYTQVKKDSDDGRVVYDVEFYAGNMEYDYEIDVATGNILDFDYDMESQYAPNVNPGSGKGNGNANAATISVDMAKQTALSRVPGATVNDITKMKTDYDDGRMEYEGTIVYNGMEYDFTIDATTGQITDWDVESIYD